MITPVSGYFSTEAGHMRKKFVFGQRSDWTSGYMNDSDTGLDNDSF
jgi:hypothetical protein